MGMLHGMSLAAASAQAPTAGPVSGTRGWKAPQQQSLFNVVGYPCVLGFLFLYYSRLLDLGLHYLHLPFVLGLIATLAAFASGNLRRILESRITLGLGLITCWLCLAIPFSVWRGGSFGVLRDSWARALIVFLAAACLVNTPSQLARIMRWVAWGIVVACSIALAANVTHWDGRLSFPAGELANANQLAFAATNGITMLWVIIGTRQHRPLFRLIAAAAVMIPIVTLSRTGSRAGLICFGLIILAGFSASKGRQRIAIILGVIVMAGLLLTRGLVERRFFTLLSSSASEGELLSAAGSAQSRMELLRDGVKLTLYNPLFGVGPGNYAVTRNAELTKSQGTSDWSVTHNAYLQISSECGIPALLLYVATIVYCFRGVSKVKQRAAGIDPDRLYELVHIGFCIKLCLITTVAFYFFSSNAYDFYFPTLAGLVVAFERLVSGAASREPVPSPRAKLAPSETDLIIPLPPAIRRNRPGLIP